MSGLSAPLPRNACTFWPIERRGRLESQPSTSLASQAMVEERPFGGPKFKRQRKPAVLHPAPKRRVGDAAEQLEDLWLEQQLLAVSDRSMAQLLLGPQLRPWSSSFWIYASPPPPRERALRRAAKPE